MCSSQITNLGIGNRRVRAKFPSWNREWRRSSQVRSLEWEMEEFEQSSDAWNREWKSSSQVRGLESDPPFPIPRVIIAIELFHFGFQASNLARTPPFSIQSIELGSNSSIPDYKPRTCPELFHSRFQASELCSDSSNSDSKLRT